MAITPDGFSVSAAELIAAYPVTKCGWSLYADKEYYYILPYGLNYLLKGNSSLARTGNLKIRGNDTERLSKLKAEKQKNEMYAIEEVLK